MTQVLLNIEDDKYKAFMDFIETLNYVSVAEKEEVFSWQVNESAIRMEKIEKGEMKTRPWNEAKSDIFKI